jgi:N-acetylglucosamine-6-phosphate deacetylase
MEATEDDVLRILRLACQRDKPVHVTHLFNVSKFHHRQVSIVNLALLSRFPPMEKYSAITEPSIELIGDCLHVHPLTLHLAMQTKDLNKIAFVTDCIMDGRAAGMSVTFVNDKSRTKRHLLWEKTSDGRQPGTFRRNSNYGRQLYNSIGYFLQPDQYSQGSLFSEKVCLTTQVPVKDAICMLSENPARIAQLHHVGTLNPSKRADILLFDENLQLSEVFVGGVQMHLEK